MGWALALTLALSAGGIRGNEVTGKDVDAAVTKALGFLKSQQGANGSFSSMYGNNGYDQGATALVLLSLVTAGMPKDDPCVTKAANYLASQGFSMTYSVALTAMALAAVDSVKYKDKIQQAADWLVASQTGNDMWTYGGGGRFGGGDGSNTQMAVLGLGEAEKAGAKVPDRTWERISRLYTCGQAADGGGVTISISDSGVAQVFL